MPKQKSSKRFSRVRVDKQVLLLAIVALAVLALSAFTYAQISNKNANKIVAPSEDSASQDGDYVNLDPPTDEEKKSTQEHKENLGQYDDPPDSGTAVTPVITYADQKEVRGYVTGVFEDGGICTATATKGGQTKTATSKAFTDVNKTTCAPMKWSLSDGGWSVTLTYKSANASGESESVGVN